MEHSTSVLLGFLPTVATEILWILLGFGFLGIFWLWQRRRARRAFAAGELREEVIVVANIIDDEGGQLLLKPRTVESAMPLLRSFPNPILAAEIIAATKRCHTKTVEGAFVRLLDQKTHGILMKRVVDIASSLGVEGHVARMCGRAIVKNECYVCITFSPDGPHRKIRIDLISEVNLKKFLDPEFVARLSNRPEEGSHADLEAIFRFCAEKVFGQKPDTTRSYVRRVSIPTIA